MDLRDVALAHARSRIAVGAALTVAPGLAAAGWIGDDARRPGPRLLARGLGARDAALGLGIAIALDRGAPVRGWLEAAALADVGDLAATLIAGDAIPPLGRRAVTAIAAGSALLCAALARMLDNPPEAIAGTAPETALTGHPHS